MIEPDGNWFLIDDFIVEMIGLGLGDANQVMKEYYAITGEFLLNFTGLNIAISGLTTFINAMIETESLTVSAMLALQTMGTTMLMQTVFTPIGTGVMGAIHGEISARNNIYWDAGAYFSDASNPLTNFLGLTWGAAAMSNGGHLSKELSEGSNMFFYTDVDNDFLERASTRSATKNYGIKTNPGFVLGNTHISAYKEDDLLKARNYNVDAGYLKALNGSDEDKVEFVYMTKLKYVNQEDWIKHEHSHVLQNRAFGAFFLVDYARDPKTNNSWEQKAYKNKEVPKTEYWYNDYKTWMNLIKNGGL